MADRLIDNIVCSTYNNTNPIKNPIILSYLFTACKTTRRMNYTFDDTHGISYFYFKITSLLIMLPYLKVSVMVFNLTFIIFQFYCGGQFYHIILYRVHLTTTTGIRNHNFSGDIHK